MPTVDVGLCGIGNVDAAVVAVSVGCAVLVLGDIGTVAVAGPPDEDGFK